MRFIAGPRQCGKTTMAQAYLKSCGDQRFYYNWDDRSLRMKYARGHDFLKEDLLAQEKQKQKNWVCFDEIHKMPKWKNILKGIFDTYQSKLRFIVTGSARLDLFRRSGDSLTGRYFLFRLFPINLFELTRKPNQELKHHSSAETWVEDQIATTQKSDQETMEKLLRFGGFPEPLLKGKESFSRIWHRDYLDTVIRDELRDLTKIGDLENVAVVTTLLPERVGSPLSLNSLRQDISVAHETISNYIKALKLCYFIFEVPVHSKKIHRSIKKEKKVYFYDCSLVLEESKRFENYIAVELFSRIAVWHDAGIGNFALCYVRQRDGKECDFLILKDNKPWCLIEVKLQPEPTPSHHIHFSQQLGNIPIVQLVQKEGVLQIGNHKDYQVSASRFLSA